MKCASIASKYDIPAHDVFYLPYENNVDFAPITQGKLRRKLNNVHGANKLEYLYIRQRDTLKLISLLASLIKEKRYLSYISIDNFL